MKFSELLQSWMAWKGREYTQKRLAFESDLTENTISHLINGKTQPDNSSIYKIADAFQISVQEFWQGPPEKKHVIDEKYEVSELHVPFKEQTKISSAEKQRRVQEIMNILFELTDEELSAAYNLARCLAKKKIGTIKKDA